MNSFQFRLLFLFALIGLSSMSLDVLAQEKTTFTTQLKNARSKKVKLRIHENLLSLEDVTEMVLPISETGETTFEFELQEPSVAYVFLDKQPLRVFLRPGDELSLGADMRQFYNSMRFAGSRTDASEVIAAIQRIDERATQGVNTGLQNWGADKFREFADKEREKRQKVLKNANTENQLSSRDKTLISAEIDYQWGIDLLQYAEYRSLFMGKKLPKKYFDFLKDIPLNNEYALRSDIYAMFINSYMNYLVTNYDAYYAMDNYYPDAIEVAKRNFEGGPMFFALAQAIVEGSSKVDLSLLEEAYENFIIECPYKGLKQGVKAAYARAKKVAAGEPAPDFFLTSMDGQEVAMGDLKGKVVYVDFWASWCGPCIQEMSYAEDVKKKFKNNKEVAFVYISLDEDVGSWQAAVNRLGIKGINLHSPGFQSEVAKAYNVQNLPHYLLIDKDGKIAMPHARRPSETKDLIKDIQRFLK